MISDEEKYYRIALSVTPRCGPVQVRRLLDQYGSATAIFRSKAVRAGTDFAAVDQTLDFARRHDIRLICPGESAYPWLLSQCYDAPIILFYKGVANLNPAHTISIVGTRTPSDYGRKAVGKLVGELAPYGPTIVSGLADGIDTLAHRLALEHGLPTIGVLGHGLDIVYPAGSRQLSKAMAKKGGLLTEFRTGVKPEAFRFPLRNRIIAGMTEATVVIESGQKGGSLITLELARGYERTVFVVPGRITDKNSTGCNDLLATGHVHCLTGAADIAQQLNWPQPTTPSDDRDPLTHLRQNSDALHIDDLLTLSGLPPAELATKLLDLEMRRVVDRLPGNRYRLHS